MILILRVVIFLFAFSYSYANTAVIGGFSAPIYIKSYNETELKEILKNEKIKSIHITYPNNLTNLAKKIVKYIKQNNPKLYIKSDELNLKDTDIVKYRHDVVIMVLFFR